MRTISTIVSLLVATSLTMGACSQSDEGEGVVKEGYFIDSAVEGVEFVSGDQSGVTDETGQFSYESGAPIEFYLGGIFLGKASEGAEYLTPIDFFADANDEFHPFVTNVARFLQTIDEDGDPSNGITVSKSMRDVAADMSLDFEQSIEDFAADSALIDAIEKLADGRPLRNVDESQEHLGQAVIGLLAGEWSGTYSGTDSGTWKIEITRSGSAGVISGTGTHPEIGVFAITGQISTSGDAEFGSGSGNAAGSVYSGVFEYSGIANGTWTAISAPNKGSWQGQRDGEPAPDNGDREEEFILPPKFSPNACVAETQGPVECAVCVFPDVFPFEVKEVHGSGFRFSLAPDPTFDDVYTAEGGTGSKSLSAYLYDSNDNEVREIEISCPTDGSSCTDTSSASVSLSPGWYKIKTETHYCDGASESRNSKTKTRATLTN